MNISKTSNCTLAVFALAFCVMAPPAPAQERAAEGQVIKGWSVGGAVVPHKFFGDLRDLPAAPVWDVGDAVEVNPRRWTGPELPEIATPAVRDPLLDIQAMAPMRAGLVTEVENFDALGTGAQPPDTTMDVGANYIIQSVNATRVRIWDKDDTSSFVADFEMSSLAGGTCSSSGGDPIILYDPMADRWVISEFGQGLSLCVYVSMTDDPVSGGWCSYQFNTPGFPDYPKYGVWPDAYWVTTNQGARVYAMDRENMMTCDTARAMQNATAPSLPGLGFQAFTPVDFDGPHLPPPGAKALMVRHRDTELGNQGPDLPDDDIIDFWEASVDFDVADSMTLTQLPNVLVSEFDTNLCPPLGVFSCVPQLSGPNLDPLVEVIMYRATYRNFGSYESIVAVLQTDVGDFEDHAGERWMEFHRALGGAEPVPNWELFQEGTYSPDSVHRFMGTIAQDSKGNILLAYAASDSTMHPGIRYTGRSWDDPAGVMTVPETTLVNGTTGNPTIRYGDYSQMGVDPEDECTFWFTVEYRGSSQSRIGAVKFDSCGGPEIFADGFESGDSTAWVPGPKDP